MSEPIYYFLFLILLLIVFFSIVIVGRYISRKELREIAERKELFELELKLRPKQDSIRNVILESFRQSREDEIAKEEVISLDSEYDRLELSREGPAPSFLDIEEEIFKSNWNEFKKLIDVNGIDCLFHFTDSENVASIIENGGLYSYKACSTKGIEIRKSASSKLSRSLDKYYKLDDYVRLSFTQKHPMMYIATKNGRIAKPFILEIDPEVIYLNGTRYSDMNAVKTGHRQGVGIEDFKRIKFDVVLQDDHFGLKEIEKAYYQAEIMVKSFIPLRYIRNL